MALDQDIKDQTIDLIKKEIELLTNIYTYSLQKFSYVRSRLQNMEQVFFWLEVKKNYSGNIAVSYTTEKPPATRGEYQAMFFTNVFYYYYQHINKSFSTGYNNVKEHIKMLVETVPEIKAFGKEDIEGNFVINRDDEDIDKAQELFVDLYKKGVTSQDERLERLSGTFAKILNEAMFDVAIKSNDNPYSNLMPEVNNLISLHNAETLDTFSQFLPWAGGGTANSCMTEGFFRMLDNVFIKELGGGRFAKKLSIAYKAFKYYKDNEFPLILEENLSNHIPSDLKGAFNLLYFISILQSANIVHQVSSPNFFKGENINEAIEQLGPQISEQRQLGRAMSCYNLGYEANLKSDPSKTFFTHATYLGCKYNKDAPEKLEYFFTETNGLQPLNLRFLTERDFFNFIRNYFKVTAEEGLTRIFFCRDINIPLAMNTAVIFTGGDNGESIMAIKVSSIYDPIYIHKENDRKIEIAMMEPTEAESLIGLDSFNKINLPMFDTPAINQHTENIRGREIWRTRNIFNREAPHFSNHGKGFFSIRTSRLPMIRDKYEGEGSVYIEKEYDIGSWRESIPSMRKWMDTQREFRKQFYLKLKKSFPYIPDNELKDFCYRIITKEMLENHESVLKSERDIVELQTITC